MGISVIEPVSPAIAWTKRILFEPFKFRKWFAVGFCAWLAYLGQGGCNLNVPTDRRDPGMAEVGNWVRAHMELVIILAIAIVAVGLIVGLLVMWLSSRGKFMFLDNLVHDRAEIREPWNRLREHGNSLFWFRLCVGLLGLLSFLLVAGLILALLWPSIQAKSLDAVGIGGIVLGVVLVLCLALAFGFVGLAVEDFMVPLMYLRGGGALPAWREFWGLFTANAGTLVLYVLFKVVIGIAIAMLTCLAICVTCCIAALPYIGTVILLPLFVFLRSYSICFLAQFGPAYRLLPDLNPPA